jgi:hypothetical protein
VCRIVYIDNTYGFYFYASVQYLSFFFLFVKAILGRKDGKNDPGCSILKDENLIIYVEMRYRWIIILNFI